MSETLTFEQKKKAYEAPLKYGIYYINLEIKFQQEKIETLKKHLKSVQNSTEENFEEVIENINKDLKE